MTKKRSSPPSVRSAPCERVCDRSALQRRRRGHHESSPLPHRLGIPLLTDEIPCPLCTQPIYPHGDHATCCAKKGDRITHHNALRNMVANIANQGMLSPVLEKQGILGSAPGRRPGDVTIQNWCDGKGLAIDVAVTSPFSAQPCQPASVRVLRGAIQAQEVREGLQGSNYLFSAIVWETTGAVNAEGEEVLRNLMRFASKRLGREHSSFCGRQWARLSICLQREVAKMILLRIGDANCSDTLANSHPDQLVTSCEELDTDIFYRKENQGTFCDFERRLLGHSLLCLCAVATCERYTSHSEPLFIYEL